LGTNLKGVAQAIDVEGGLILLGLSMLFADLYIKWVWLAFVIVGSLLFILGVLVLRGGK